MTRQHLLVLSLLALSLGCRSPVDLQQPLGFPCDPGVDAPAAQCPEGSRCGLEGSCHVLGVAADYVCATDADCEGGWRCSTEKRCADVSQEALELTSPNGTPVLEPLVPALFVDPEPRLLATTETEIRVGCGGAERTTPCWSGWGSSPRWAQPGTWRSCTAPPTASRTFRRTGGR